MKSKLRTASAILFGLTLLPYHLSHAGTLVNDTWLDGTRTDQENGIDTDADGNIESAWFGSSATNLTASIGHLTGTVGAGSSSWTTYFAGEGNEATLVNPGDTLTISWKFTLTGINATNNSQGFRLAAVNSPSASRVTTDAAPGASTYAGYGMFMNVGQDIGHTNPFQLMERTDPITSSALLSASGSWTALNDQEVIGPSGYVAGTSYTFLMSMTLIDLGQLSVSTSMSGGSLGGDGLLQAAFTDATPNSLSFDTFSLRPSSDILSAATFDTTAFSVTLTSVPEPSATMAFAGLALVVLRRRRA